MGHSFQLLGLDSVLNFKPSYFSYKWATKALYCSPEFKVVLGIGQENHNRLSEELNRLIIDCTIGFLLAMSNNIQ